MRRIIIHADDFGISEGANEAIIDCHLRGVLTSTSVLATLPAFGHAVSLRAEAPDLDCGAHLSLNLGRPAAPPAAVSLLLDGNGMLRYSFAYHLYRSLDKAYLRQVGIEVEAQLTKLIDSGFELSHADSQQHVHMIPGIRDVIAEKINQTGIPYLRHSVEPWSGHPGIGRPVNLLKCATVALFAARRRHLGNTIGFIGLRHTGQMTADRLAHYFATLGPGKWEIAVHPGTGRLDRNTEVHRPIADYLLLKERRIEWDALISGRIRECIDANGIKLVGFSDA